MLSKVVLVTLLAVVAVAAADVETEAAPAKENASADKPTTFKPHMHRRGALRSGHVRPFPVGYDTAKWRHDVRWNNGGVALTTEQLLKRFPDADTRHNTVVPSKDWRGAYDWETPEYEFEYVARTGEDVRGRRPRRIARQNLPVVHYPRRIPVGGRPARTPRAPGSRRGRRSGRRPAASRKPKTPKASTQQKPKAAKKAKRTSAQRLDRLEKVMTFALRQLKRNLKRSKRLETFATKSKRAIQLIAKALSGDEKHMKLSANHMEMLRRAALKTRAQLTNLHKRSKALASISKKHKQIIGTIAKELVKTQNSQNQIVDNVKVLRAAAHAAETGIKNLDTRSKATTVLIGEHAKKIVKNEKNLQQTNAQQKATVFNVKALHNAASNAQKAIRLLDARSLKSARTQANEKTALKLAFGAIKQLAKKTNKIAKTAAKK